MMNKLYKLKKDIISGFIISLISLPLCLGIAIASGTPIYSGFISGIIGGIVIGLLSDSNISISGPAAGLSSVVIFAMYKLKNFKLFLCVVLIAGFLQIIYGILKLGFISNYISSSVVEGMLSGIGFMIILKHIPLILGFSFKNMLSFFLKIKYIFYYFNIYLFLTGMFFLFLIYFLSYNKNKIFNLKIPIPSSLLIIILGILVHKIISIYNNDFLYQKEYLINLPNVNSVVNFYKTFFTFPSLIGLYDLTVWKMGFILSLVASIETLISIEAVDKLDPYKRHTSRNKELIVQGIGNIFCSLIGGLPLTSVVLRSSANLNAGAKTKYSTIIHGILLLLFISIFPNIINNILLSSLGALLILTGLKLCNWSIIIKSWKEDKIYYFIPFIFTFFMVLFYDLLIAVLLGIIVNIILFLFKNIYNPLIYKSYYKDNTYYLYISFYNYSIFLHKNYIKLILDNLPNGSVLIIDLKDVLYMDYDIKNLFIDYMNMFFTDKHIKIYFLNVSSINFFNNKKLLFDNINYINIFNKIQFKKNDLLLPELQSFKSYKR